MDNLVGSSKDHAGAAVQPEWNFWETQAQYAPFLKQRNATEEELPPHCEITQVNILHRHTARFPTHSALLAQRRSIAKLAASPWLTDEAFLSKHPQFFFLRNLSSNAKDSGLLAAMRNWKVDELTDLGRRSAYISGQEYRERYHSLVSTPGTDRPLFTRSSAVQRVVETAGYWLMGYRDKEFRLPLDRTEEMELVDLVMENGIGTNSSLRVRSCPAFQEQAKAHARFGGPPTYTEYLALAGSEPMDHLSGILDLPVRLDNEDYISIMSLCSYEASAKSLLDVDDPGAWYAFVAATRPGWCGVFVGMAPERERAVWEGYAYAHDVRKHYERSSGGIYGPSMGVGYVNELLARFRDTVPQDHTTTNTTLDGDECTFPRGGRRMFVDFSHDNEMLYVLAALNIMTDKDLPVTRTPSSGRNFMQQRLTPFGATFLFERISCRTDGPTFRAKTFVRIFINNVRTMVDHPACSASSGNTLVRDYGACGMDAFLESQMFSRKGGDWERCFAGLGERRG